MRVCITGASGLVGTRLNEHLRATGHSVVSLSRSGKGDNAVRWDPEHGELDPASLQGVDSVVNLAGDNIGDGRWTAEKKARILDSRVKSTRLISETIAKLPIRPQVMVSASAIGYYGDRGDEICVESSPPGTGFLPDVCCKWEEATRAAEDAGIRVVHLRIGVVLSTRGGPLTKMLTPFRMGVGGVLGSGKQYFSWVALEDLIAIIAYALTNDKLSGPLNATAPLAVTNKEFTKTLGKVIHRPTIFPMPAFAARVAFGEMADGLLLASARVKPERLELAGFPFKHPDVESALCAAMAERR